MAATSGGSSGVDWSSIIKPFVTYSVSSLSRSEVVTLVKVISESEADFKESISPNHHHSVFYDVVTVLSSHIITVATNGDLLPRASFPVAKQAAKVLCESLLDRFSHVLRTTHPILNVKTYINALQEFCTGEVIITKDEVANMLALLKGQELPPKIQSSAPCNYY
ncbi:E3 ubiquitin-protein ligase UBR4 [Orchesella cincta]|uniref:E3 ubiquitin-protein ligase UBR4 n=1 Tax=Orchesella cincta TaxID=48709 RepID=A0A1D2MSX7_ORCCI|nr:E3 ubiquitin-protein ligase UBR4 [Orchesella cincta]